LAEGYIIEDEMYAIRSRYKKLIYSHETARFLHGLSDRIPFEYSATVPSGYKVVEILKATIRNMAKEKYMSAQVERFVGDRPHIFLRD
jgi:hypothetical protein